MNNSLPAYDAHSLLDAHLVVPCLTVAISAAPYVESGVNGHGAVACPGSRDRLLKHLHRQRFPCESFCTKSSEDLEIH